jgi:hypothetical protein
MNKKVKQLSFADYQINSIRKLSRNDKKLSKIDNIVDWDKVLSLIECVDKSRTKKGGVSS